MRRRRNKRPNLQVELLESRVLLSGADAAPSVEVQMAVESALHSTGYVDVELPYDSVLKISGAGEGSLTIDLNALPNSVIQIEISSFSSVTFEGQQNVRALILTGIDKVDAGQLSIGETLAMHDVDRIQIDSAPALLLVGNPSAGLGGKTLLEVDRFSESTLILSYVDNLGIAGGTGEEQLFISSGNPSQTIMFDAQPRNTPKVDGIDSKSQVSVIEGNFVGYFLASPAERAALEQSPVIVRSEAIIEHVSLATLVGDAKLQALIGGTFQSAPTDPHARPLQPTLPLTAEVDANGTALVHSLDAVSFNTGSAALSLPTLPSVTSGELGPSEQAAAPIQGVGTGRAPELAQIAFGESRPAPESDSQAGLAALSAALARLTEPFVQTVFNLQGRFASFGDLVTAQVNDQLRTESRPVLLADTRTGRQREGDETVIVNL